MSDFINKVVLFNEIAGTTAEFNTRKLALYMGLILEETQEMIREVANISGDEELVRFSTTLEKFATEFKRGDYDLAVANVNRKEVLDAAVDIAVVSVGAGISVGADIAGACMHIANNNLSKYNYNALTGEYIVLKDINGKIMKPANYQKPELGQFLK